MAIDQRHWVLGAFNLQTFQMTIHDTLQNEGLSDIVVTTWTVFLDNLVECYRELNQPELAHRVRMEARFEIAKDTPKQTGSTGDCGPWICRLMAEFTGFMDFSKYSPDRTQSIIDFRHYMADLFWSGRILD